MSIFVKEISIGRHPSLGSVAWQLADLSDITVLFGKNGSGKSLLLRQWRDQDLIGVHYIAPERTGELTFNPSHMQEQIEAQGRKNSSSRNFVPEYRSQIISRIQGYFVARGSYRGNQLPGDPAELEQFLNQLIPDFAITLQGRNPPYQLVRLSTGEAVGGVDSLSSGEAQLVTVALDILTIASIWEIENKTTRILLIDEPDAHIHPDLQIRFADFLVQVSIRFSLQVVVATHSTTLLSAFGQFGGDKASVIYLERKPAQLKAQKFNAVLREVAACLGGHILMGPLFGSPLLLVEGDDDYRIWSQVPRHHQIKLAAIPTNGEEIYKYQRTIEQIFASLREHSSLPLGYALLDSDKPLPQEGPSSPQQFIKFIRLNCFEAENLYLTDEVLSALGLTWAEAKEKIFENSKNYGNKQSLLVKVSTCDRKTADIKNTISELSQILDPKHVHWTIRVGAQIGRQKPTGQLAEFLGEEVLRAFWID